MNNIYFCKAIEIDTLTQRRVTDLLAELNQLGIIKGINIYQGRYRRKKIITNITSKIPQSNFYKGLSSQW
jgi:Cdc6-like AAA superfamily ATPase